MHAVLRAYLRQMAAHKMKCSKQEVNCPLETQYEERSAVRFTAAQAGFSLLIQCGERPATRSPQALILQACANTSGLAPGAARRSRLS